MKTNLKLENLNYPSLKKSMVVVVDMVNGFIKEGAMHDKNIMNIVPNIKQLLEAHDSPDNELFFVDSHNEYCQEFASFPPHCVVGTTEEEIIDELKPYVKKEPLKKNSTNGIFRFMNSSYLEPLLHSDSVIITGCCTDICVMQFALSLKTWLNETNLPIKIYVPMSCVETYDAPNHNAKEYNEIAAKLMMQAGICVVEDITYFWDER